MFLVGPVKPTNGVYRRLEAGCQAAAAPASSYPKTCRQRDPPHRAPASPTGKQTKARLSL